MATKKWSAKVDTDSTHPEHGLFNKSASTIAKRLATREVSPKGPASGMRMLNFYINRAGKNLSATRLKTLEHAKEILSGIIASGKEKPTPKPARRKPAKKAAKKLAKKSSRTTASRA
jgi:hypothetical protein